ncbi:MAG: sigma-70 family RNA polymerase sigma factor [Phycisphaerales bacterium]
MPKAGQAAAAKRPALPKDPHAAIPELVRSCGPMVHAVVRRMVRSAADADDVVQDAFLQAYRHWGEFRGDSSPCTWLHAIAVRAALRQGQRESRRRTVTQDYAREYARAMPFAQPRLALADFPAGSPESRELRREARQQVDRAVSQLAEPFRSAVVLKEIAGMSLAEVAAVLGVKESTVKTRVHRGRLLLRAKLLDSRPRAPVPPAVYERAVCMDLLRAKMEALDRGADFPVQDDLVCERCKEVFASLDVAADACRSLRSGSMPAALRAKVMAALKDEGRGEEQRARGARAARATAPARARRTPR